VASRPRVSIGVAIYNEAKFLRSTLDSVLAQDFTDFELIISDNASTDGTQEISLEYVARDPRVSYHRNETNVGATENFNLVFKYATGEYFMWLRAELRVPMPRRAGKRPSPGSMQFRYPAHEPGGQGTGPCPSPG